MESLDVYDRTEAEPRQLSKDQEPPAAPIPVQRKGWPRTDSREWVHIGLLLPPPCIQVDLQLVPRLIGNKGENTKAIFAETDAKARIRGIGSGHLEVDGIQEAQVPLQFAVTVAREPNVPWQARLKRAVEMAILLLLQAQKAAQDIWETKQCPGKCPPIFYMGDWSTSSSAMLMKFIKAYPKPKGIEQTKRTTPAGIRVVDKTKLAADHSRVAAPQSKQCLNLPLLGLEKAMSREAVPLDYSGYRTLAPAQWPSWQCYSQYNYTCEAWQAQCYLEAWCYDAAWDAWVAFGGAATQPCHDEHAEWMGTAAHEMTQAAEQEGGAPNHKLASQLHSETSSQADTRECQELMNMITEEVHDFLFLVKNGPGSSTD